MADIFDENGNAKITSVVTVYGINPETGEYNGAYDVRILAGTGIPGFSSTISPPEAVPEKCAVLVNGAWEVVPDHRGKKAFSCENGAESAIGYLGEIREGFTLIAPATPYDFWDKGKWATDTAAQRAGEISAAATEKSRLYAIASEKIAPLRDASDGGYIDESDKPLLNAWQKYRYDLSKVDTSSLPVAFPAVPA